MYAYKGMKSPQKFLSFSKLVLGKSIGQYYLQPDPKDWVNFHKAIFFTISD